MTQERIEAAAKALNESYGLKWARLPWPELVKSSDNANQNRVKLDREYAANALAAADAILFSDEAIERAAGDAWNMLVRRDGGRPWDQLPEGLQRSWILNVHVMVEALKGGTE
jgi:hypothetical protein